MGGGGVRRRAKTCGRRRGSHLQRDDRDAENEESEDTPLRGRELAAEKQPLEGGGEEGLGLLDDRKRARVDALERHKPERVHHEVEERGDGHWGRVA